MNKYCLRDVKKIILKETDSVISTTYETGNIGPHYEQRVLDYKQGDSLVLVVEKDSIITTEINVELLTIAGKGHLVILGDIKAKKLEVREQVKLYIPHKHGREIKVRELFNRGCLSMHTGQVTYFHNYGGYSSLSGVDCTNYAILPSTPIPDYYIEPEYEV